MRNRTLPIVELLLLGVFVVSFPLVVYVSTLPVASFRNEITHWGDRDSQTYQEFADYKNMFTGNEFVVVRWPGCDLKDDRVLDVSKGIKEQLSETVSQVSSGQSVYWTLRDDVGLSDSQARKRMRRVFIGEDDNSTALALRLTDAGRSDRAAVVETLTDILRQSGVDPAQAQFGGLGHNLYALDKEGLESPFRVVPLIMLLALVLTFVSIRHFWLALFINSLGVYTGCLAFNFIYWAAVDLNAILWPLPTLTMLLTVSAALHFLSYFRKVASSFNSRTLLASVDQSALQRSRAISYEAFIMAWKPMLFCAITTTIGLASLQLSSSSPVRQFGLFGGISIVVACGLTLLWLPAFLTVIRYGQHREGAQTGQQEKPRSADAQLGAEGDQWSRLAWFTRKFRWPIIIASLASLVVMSLGIPKIKTGSDVQNFFPENHHVLADLREIEDATGPLNAVELLLEFSNPQRANDKSRIRGVQTLCAKIVETTAVDSCISAATFAPVWKKRARPMQAIAERKRVERLKAESQENGLLAVVPRAENAATVDSSENGVPQPETDNLQETWRISCLYFGFRESDDSSNGGEVDLPKLCAQLNATSREVFMPEGDLVFDGESLEIITTGEFVVFDEVDRQFFSELMKTYLTAFVLISIVVLSVMRIPSSLWLALPPNLFPAVMVLGAAGHLGYTLDVASLMTASVALGIAVDDTLHFMLWWKHAGSASGAEGVQSGKVSTLGDPIEQAMRYSGTAMTQTSFILGLSIVLYAFCGFLPTVRFGWLLCGMMFSALVGDLILLPALLAAHGDRDGDGGKVA